MSVKSSRADEALQEQATNPRSWQVVVRPLAERTVRESLLPGMLVAVTAADGSTEYLALGSDAVGQPLAHDTLFPVASITKLATALSVLRLASFGALSLDDPLAHHVPEAATATPGVTLRSILCHAAGLPDDVARGLAPYRPGLDWLTLARACLATPAAAPPGARVHYSNLGPGLLAIVVERLTGVSFARALADLVLEPLGIEGYLGVEPPRRPAVIGGALGKYAGTDQEPFNSPFWRSLAMPWGGMIATAEGALRLVRAFAGRPAGFLPLSLLAESTSDQAGGLPGELDSIGAWTPCAWGLGVDLRGKKTPHYAPATASPRSFGHAGASGCMVWHEPESGVSWFIHGAHTFQTWWQSWPALGEAVLSTAA